MLRKLEHNYMTSRNQVTQIMQIMRELCKYTWRLERNQLTFRLDEERGMVVN